MRIKLIDFNPDKHKLLRWYFSSHGKDIDAPVSHEQVMASQTNAVISMDFDTSVKYAKENPKGELHFNINSGGGISRWYKVKTVYIDVEVKQNERADNLRPEL